MKGGPKAAVDGASLPFRPGADPRMVAQDGRHRGPPSGPKCSKVSLYAMRPRRARATAKGLLQTLARPVGARSAPRSTFVITAAMPMRRASAIVVGRS